LEYAEDNLPKEDINNFLLARDNKRINSFHVAAEWGKLDILQTIWECANEILTREKINNTLLATDRKGITAWLKTAEKGKLNTFRKIWDWSIEGEIPQEIMK
jgi:hypothetical protein